MKNKYNLYILNIPEEENNETKRKKQFNMYQAKVPEQQRLVFIGQKAFCVYKKTSTELSMPNLVK
jgi:predicted transcriptional regulator